METSVTAIQYMREGNGKSYALAHAMDVIAQVGGYVTARERTVHYEPLHEHRVSAGLLWGMAKAVAWKQAEPQLHTHNVLFNIAPRPRDPATPLAGKDFDPRRYRRP